MNYQAFRYQVAFRSLLSLLASMQKSLPLLLGVLGPSIVGAAAFIAFPGCYAASKGILDGLGVASGAAFLLATPLYALQHRLLPADVIQWSHGLPVSRSERLRADVSCVRIIMAPLGGLGIISLVIWLWQMPKWLAPIWPQAIAVNVAIFGAAYLLGTTLLHVRGAQASGETYRSRGAKAVRYLKFRRGWHTQWHHLLWLPFWRDGQYARVKQFALAGVSTVAIIMWLLPSNQLPWPRTATCLLASFLIMLQVTHADKVLQRQLAHVSPLLRCLPIRPWELNLYPCLIAVAPALLAIGAFGAMAVSFPDFVAAIPATLYAICALLAVIGVVFWTRTETHLRLALVALSICVETAIGSELWK